MTSKRLASGTGWVFTTLTCFSTERIVLGWRDEQGKELVLNMTFQDVFETFIVITYLGNNDGLKQFF